MGFFVGILVGAAVVCVLVAVLLLSGLGNNENSDGEYIDTIIIPYNFNEDDDRR